MELPHGSSCSVEFTLHASRVDLEAYAGNAYSQAGGTDWIHVDEVRLAQEVCNVMRMISLGKG